MKRNLYTLVLCFAWLAYTPLQAQQVTTFILVRHAEKSLESTDDPSLSTQGQERAQRLMRLLEEVEIDVLYASQYQRTLQTLQPYADSRKKSILRYKAAESEGLVLDCLKKHSGKTILIAGHSNTLSLMLNALLGKQAYQPLADSEYEDVFVVSVWKKGAAQVLRLKYPLP